MHRIGEDRNERPDIVPAQLGVIVTVRRKYACRKAGSGHLAAPRAFQVRGRFFSNRDTIRVIGKRTTMYSSAPTISGVAFTYCDCKS